MALLNLVTGWLLFGSLALMIGVAIGHWFILPRPLDADAPAARLDRASARLGFVAGAVLVVALCLVFLRQILEFRDPFVPWVEDAKLLLGVTPWGRAWLFAGGGTIVALASFWLALRAHPTGWAAASAAALALGAFPAFTGHANSGELRALTLGADILHVWAVGAWIGGLGLVLYLEHRRPHSGDSRPSVLPVLIPRFSVVAVVSVLTLVVTGVVGSWIHLESPSALVDTQYGRVLLFKLGLVLLILALGARNWRRLKPRLIDPGVPLVMRRTASLEFILANAVLIVTAVLVRTPPAEL